MIKFNTTILKFAQKGEKTSWSYIEINAARAKIINPDTKCSFRVKGTLDKFVFEKLALIPMGDGNFILPMNATIRKAIGKKQGDTVTLVMEVDERELTLSHDLMICLKDDPLAMAFFKSLPKSHQNYFSKWIESAKTSSTKAKRIVMAMTAFSKHQGYSEMMRENKTLNY